MGTQIGENIVQKLVGDSIGQWRRREVLARTVLHPHFESPLEIRWNYALKLEKPKDSPRFPSLATLIAPLPALRKRWQRTTIFSFIRDLYGADFDTGSREVCMHCRTPLVDAVEDDLNSIIISHPQALLALCLRVDKSLNTQGVSVEDLISMFAVERIITENNILVRSDVSCEAVQALVLDTANATSFKQEGVQRKKWIQLINRIGALDVFSINQNKSVEYVQSLYSVRFCRNCKELRGEHEKKICFGNLAVDELGNLSVGEFLNQKQAVSQVPTDEVLECLCRAGLDFKSLSEVVGALEDELFVCVTLVAALLHSKTEEIFVEGNAGIFERIIFGVRKKINRELPKSISICSTESGSADLSSKSESFPQVDDVIAPIEGKLSQCIGALIGALSQISPLYAGTPASRKGGFSQEAFELEDPSVFCQECHGTGMLGQEGYALCVRCNGTRINEDIASISYHGVTFGDLLSAELMVLREQIIDPKFHSLLDICCGLGFENASLRDSWMLFDTGERTRLSLVAMIEKRLQKRKKGNRSVYAPYFASGLGMQGAKKAVDSLTVYLPRSIKVFVDDPRPAIRCVLRRLESNGEPS